MNEYNNEHSKMIFFYGAMIGIPVLMWLIAVLSYFTTFNIIKGVLGILLAIGCFVYSIMGFREVFMHD